MTSKLTLNQRIYISAYDDYQYHKYQKAVNKLDHIYNDHVSPQINKLMVKSLFKLKDYQKAGTCILEIPDNYTNSFQDFNFMIEVLLKNHSFIRTREFVATIENLKFKEKELQRILKSEKNYQRLHAASIDDNLNAFCNIINKKISVQKQILDQSFKLPFSKFVFGCKYLLNNPFLNVIMRISILEVLQKIEFNHNIEMQWIDHHKHTVNPFQLTILSKTSSYLELFKLVNQKYGHDDPIMTFRLKNIFNLQLLILYPYNDRIITNCQLWFKITELMINYHHPVIKNEKETEYYRWQCKLKEIINN